ncbi:hypothetical protein LO762_29080 [Actinocorallia sp. API 0066]|uniref:hypothetical protein n=1 Tax=Actinocorallia sp. API 0066 TaxID=2896846 RepID=UPI001E2F4F1C|nr:hypothetical protein [Actinocorallia sp. API 0066]MCD0453205.1 hypothetical protein [Actinocorallia sp. API 0066]
MSTALAGLTSAALVIGLAQPVSAAPVVLDTNRSTVVVGDGGSGVWTTFTARGGAVATARAVDLWLTAPDGERVLVDLVVKGAPGIWTGVAAFNRFDAPGQWRATLNVRDGSGKQSTAGRLVFHVKRKTTLSAANPKGRGGSVGGVLRRLAPAGGYQPYGGQKIHLYRWTDGAWRHVATTTTGKQGRYSFAARPGKLQLRYAGTAVNAPASQTTQR